ncbi:helix-turn-helix transcriptional regulator [Erythrobacter sp. GH3-10]|uniref:Helix-turn-helix transcriptional regulator n=2 Tax=Aurantiacibacter rhizosphaerae TaxID=2691582 RepID=A0A844XDR2_9SPHN|nr:helix-turn-helix transcriptional regulator [Aurantiacibacter rhizosphaerae]MWV27889.1 helix-turn-helix transcriptional regulator [Aurantiacibacter rhizosphaerae]
MRQVQETSDLLDDLTDKQREVLDLLVQHMTSKQIARELGISPHTVDQRIVSARRKFGVETRNELAAAYMAALPSNAPAIYDKSVYQSSQVENDGQPADNNGGLDAVLDESEVLAPPGEPPVSTKPYIYYRVVPESFEGRSGYFWRLIAIVGITLGLLIATLVGLAIFAALSELLR